jgi:hypothetical protein
MATQDFEIPNVFRQKVTVHARQKTLTDVKTFFYLARSRCKIVNYAVLEGGVVLPQDSIKKKDLKICEICGTPLYHFSEFLEEIKIDPADLDDKSNVKKMLVRNIGPDLINAPVTILKKNFAAKRHMVFIDTVGVAHSTCYKPKDCFRRIDWNVEQNTLDKAMEYTVTDIIPVEDVDKRSEAYRRLESVFEARVKPFIEKWSYVAVDKSNCLELMKELDGLQDFMNLFEDGAPQKMALHSICRCIGVKV